MSEPIFLLEENHDLPLCRVRVTVRTGAATDPKEEDGVPLIGICNFATELMRRGAGGRTRVEIDELVDGLGASIHVMCGHDSVVFETLALKEKLPQVCSLLSDVMLRPDYSELEAGRLRRELLADLDDLRDDDGTLARRFFYRELFGDHPYGRPVAGTEHSFEHLTTSRARAWQKKYLTRGNVIFGAAGDLRMDEMRGLFERHFAGIPDGPPLDTTPPEPVAVPGIRVLLVDKPERTQTQILIGQLGPKWNQPTWLPMQVALTAFGGTFTARLMYEVREKRGLSYGASAGAGSGRGRRGVVVHVFPAAQKTAETLELVLGLYTDWATGLRPEEIEFARGYLAKGHAFSVQTAESRLGMRTELLLCDLPEERMRTYPERVRAVTEEDVRAAMALHLRPKDLLITLVATEKTLGPLLSQVEALGGAPVQVLPFDSY